MAVVATCPGEGGRLIYANVRNSAPLTLAVSYSAQGGDPDPSDLVRLGVVTHVRARQAVAAQFQNALNDLIFITPFGDLPGDVAISFLANNRCDDSSTGRTPFGAIQEYFDRRLLPSANKLPAIIVIGSGTFKGYLTGLSIDAASQDIPMVSAALLFKAWPDD